MLSDGPRCTAHSKRSGQPCRARAMTGRMVCRMHGGKTPRGLAASGWKHGRHSKALPRDLVDAYERARSDPELIALQDELALVDARMTAVLGRLRTGDAGAVWGEVYELIELRRRLADTERKRLEQLQVMITAEQAMAFVGAVASSVKRHVRDRAVLQAISDDVEQVLRSRPELVGTADRRDEG
jgi:hypothetical protein